MFLEQQLPDLLTVRCQNRGVCVLGGGGVSIVVFSNSKHMMGRGQAVYYQHILTFRKMIDAFKC